MPFKTRPIRPLVIAVLGLLMASFGPREACAQSQWAFPPPPPPEEYGNVLISRLSASAGVQPVVFSHWVHRQKFTCRVCHFEIEFAMKANGSEITEAESRAGKFCGVCHNGTRAFGHEKQHCGKCHSGTRGAWKDKFAALAGLPKASFGDGKNWVKALERGMIKPQNYLTMKPPEEITFDKELILEAEWSNIPHVVFPHKSHVEWLDCNNCHPDPFNIKKKTTKHFEMRFILDRQFCGVCHMTVAFPMQDCQRCHHPVKTNTPPKRKRK